MNLYNRIDWDFLAQIMLLAEFGQRVHIMNSGEIEVLGSQECLADHRDVVAILQTPGLGNMDSGLFTMEFVRWDEEEETYIEIATGRRVGGLEEVVLETIKGGDLTTDFFDPWKREIEEQAQETQAECHACKKKGVFASDPLDPVLYREDDIIFVDPGGNLSCWKCSDEEAE